MFLNLKNYVKLDSCYVCCQSKTHDYVLCNNAEILQTINVQKRMHEMVVLINCSHYIIAYQKLSQSHQLRKKKKNDRIKIYYRCSKCSLSIRLTKNSVSLHYGLFIILFTRLRKTNIICSTSLRKFIIISAAI